MSEDFRNRPLGVIPSPADNRDYNISRLIAQAPSGVEPEKIEYDFAEYIKNQKDIGQCVSAAGSGAREIIEKKQNGGIHKIFSMGFNYGYRQPSDYKGPGMVPRQYLANLMKFGIPDYDMFPIEKEWPEIQQEVNKSNLIEILKNAYPRRISAYARLNSNDEIKLALRTLGPVIVCIPVYSSFYKISATNPILPKYNAATETKYGSHAVLIVGYNNKTGLYKIANSWGTGFGEKGFFYASFDWPFTEMWSITDNYIPGNYSVVLTYDKKTAHVQEQINVKVATQNNNKPSPNQNIKCNLFFGNDTTPFNINYTTDNNGGCKLPAVMSSDSSLSLKFSWDAPDGNVYETEKLTLTWEGWKVVTEFDNKLKADTLMKDLRSKGYKVSLI